MRGRSLAAGLSLNGLCLSHFQCPFETFQVVCACRQWRHPLLSACPFVRPPVCIDSWSLPGRQTTTIQVHTTPPLLTLWEVFEFCCSLNEAKWDQKGASVSLWVWGENVFTVDSGEPAAWTYYNQSTQGVFCSSACKQRDGNGLIGEPQEKMGHCRDKQTVMLLYCGQNFVL